MPCCPRPIERRLWADAIELHLEHGLQGAPQRSVRLCRTIASLRALFSEACCSLTQDISERSPGSIPATDAFTTRLSPCSRYISIRSSRSPRQAHTASSVLSKSNVPSNAASDIARPFEERLGRQDIGPHDHVGKAPRERGDLGHRSPLQAPVALRA